MFYSWIYKYTFTLAYAVILTPRLWLIAQALKCFIFLTGFLFEKFTHSGGFLLRKMWFSEGGPIAFLIHLWVIFDVLYLMLSYGFWNFIYGTRATFNTYTHIWQIELSPISCMGDVVWRGCLLMFSLFLWPGAYLRGGLLCMYTGHKILFHRDNKFSLLLYYCTMNNLSVPLFHWKDRVTTERQTN